MSQVTLGQFVPPHLRFTLECSEGPFKNACVQVGPTLNQLSRISSEKAEWVVLRSSLCCPNANPGLKTTDFWKRLGGSVS